MKKTLKLLRNKQNHIHYYLYEADGWGHYKEFEGHTKAQDILTEWLQYKDDLGMDGIYYRAVAILHNNENIKMHSFCPTKEELERLISLGH